MIKTRLLVALPLVIGAISAVVWWQNNSFEAAEDVTPVVVSSNSLTFDSLEPLLAQTDLIVVGTVLGVESGRVFTDPSQTDSGIKSQLVEIDVDDVVYQVAGRSNFETLIVEQEASLLDNTPLHVDGIAPLRLDDRVLIFLTAGESQQAPHFSLVGPQGLYHVDDGRASPLRAPGVAGQSDQIESFAGLTLEEAIFRIDLTVNSST